MYLFFDTETTGLPRSWKAPLSDLDNWPRLVQLAYVLCDENGTVINAENYIIKPDGFMIPFNVSKIHGITTEKALREGHPVGEVLLQFDQLMGQATHLVAHNMAFDEKIIGAELIRNGLNNCISSKQKICTMESTTTFCALEGRYGYKWPKLSELHFKLFNTGFDEAHNAAVDIAVTAKCFWELRRLGKL